LVRFPGVAPKTELALLKKIQNYFECGKILYPKSKKPYFMVSKHEELKNIVVPFFEKHELRTPVYNLFENMRGGLILHSLYKANMKTAIH